MIIPSRAIRSISWSVIVSDGEFAAVGIIMLFSDILKISSVNAKMMCTLKLTRHRGARGDEGRGDSRRVVMSLIDGGPVPLIYIRDTRTSGEGKAMLTLRTHTCRRAGGVGAVKLGP